MKNRARKHPDTVRLDRVLEDKDLVLVINRYGHGAAGNTAVCIYDRADIDAVLASERKAKGERG